jgi:hypothetical protein
VVDNRIFGVAGGVQHLEPGPALLDLVGELTAVHGTRHDHVGEQQIEAMARIDDGKRLRRIRRIQRDVTERLQLRQHVVADQLVILDDENGLGPALNNWCGRLRGKRGAGGRRQVHPDRRSMTFLAVDLDVPLA